MSKAFASIVHRLRDATDPRQAAEHLSALAGIAGDLLAAEEPHDIAPIAFKHLAGPLQLDVCFNYLAEDSGTLALLACEGVPDDAVRAVRRLELGQAVCGVVALEREMHVAERIDATTEPALATLRALGVRAYACFPMLSPTRLLGTLAFGSRSRETFATEDLELMGIVSNQVGIALERARLLGERERDLGRLQHSEERYRLVAQTVQDAIWDFDVVTGRTACSDALLRVFGYPPRVVAEMDGLTWWTATVHPEDRPRVVQSFQTALHAGEHHWVEEYRFRRADGAYAHVMDRAVIVRDETGTPVRVVGAMLDVSERQEALRALEEAHRRKDEFLATLAHELRQPLAPILIALDLLRHQVASSGLSLEPSWRVIERQVGQLTRLVDDLLDWGRIAQSKLLLRVFPHDIKDPLLAAVQVGRASAEGKRQQLTILVPDTPLMTIGDRDRLQQVFSNLLTNATKFTPPGGRIDVSARVEGDRIEVHVADSGPGIDESVRDKMFEMFVQGPGASGGLGVGLALTKRLVELHGGTIEARRQKTGTGSDFVVVLPAWHPSAAE